MPPEGNPDLGPGTSVGQYTIVRRIGAGGMGEVYEAMHTGLNKKVAIKTLRRHYGANDIITQRFLREGQLASRLRHPNVVDMTDVGIIAGLPCLVMEYLEGESLHAMFKREGALDVSRLVDLVLPVAAAVDAAHRLGIVHRDLKPANIFLAQSWNGEIQPKVLDFGISKVMEDAPGELTTDSTFLGSPHYVSPELARGDKHLDGRSDQYSMGVILYEGLCGVRPFAERAETFMSLMFAIGSGEFPPPRSRRPDISPELEAIVLRAMAKQKNDRFPSVGVLGRVLLPYASPRARMIWEPALGDPSQPASYPAPRSSIPSLSSMPPSSAAPASTEQHTVFAGPRSSISLEESQGTLGRSASEIRSLPVPEPAQPLGVVARIAAGIAALLVGLALALGATKLVTASRSADSDAEGDDTVVTTPQTYAVTVAIEPKDAVIEIDGRPIGNGEFTRTFTADGTSHTLRLSAPGYVTKTVVFSSTSPPDKQITLDSETATPETKSKKRPSPPAPAPKPSAGIGLDKRDPWDEK
jgi:serine/threonine protein kinase